MRAMSGFRTVIRPLVPHFAKCVYQKRLLRKLVPEPDALTCRQFLQPGSTVIDIGANIGAYTKLFSDWVGPEGSVHSYEPIPETFSYLENNVKKLGMTNVTVHNVAVSSQPGTMKMKIPDRKFYQARISPDGDQEVALVRLDDEFPQTRGIAFIKCDVEYHEAFVIEGALKIIQRDHPVWLMETSDDSVIERMKSLGYKATHLSADWLFQ
jgi:FkbM family methyltransferase